MSKIVEDLKKLVDSYEKYLEQNPPPGAALDVKSISDKYADLLSSKTKEALATSFKDTVYPRPERKAIFLTARAYSEAGIEKAAQALSQEVEALVEMGVVLGHLQPLSTIKLADLWELNGEVVGFSSQSKRFIGNGKYLFSEEPPKNAVFKSGGWAVVIFPVVKWEFEPVWYTPLLNTKLYRQEGEISDAVFE